MSSKKNFAVIMMVLTGFVFNAFAADSFQSCFPVGITRTWIGSQYWANPLQDWQLNKERIECVVSGGDRNVYLLTYELADRSGDVTMSVTLGQLDPAAPLDDGYIGFKIGIRGQFDDYRDSAVRGDGFCAGLHTDGRLFIGKLDKSTPRLEPPFDNITLELKAVPNRGTYNISLTAMDEDGNILSKVQRKGIDSDWLTGGLALACSSGKVEDMPDSRPPIDDGNWGFREGTNRGGNLRFWFADWKIAGSKVAACPEQAFGPILFAQHTLSRKTLKLTVQMPPIGENDSQIVQLQTKKEVCWEKIADAKIDDLACTAEFKIANWNDSKNTPYRLVYSTVEPDGKTKDNYFEGIIRKDPKDKSEIVVAVFTGNNDLGFPNGDFVKHVAYHKPDVLFFSGDQIYEGVAGYGVQTSPAKTACTDYLRKWYLYGWAYADLLKDIPTVAITDDHDVYHGNIWGASGKKTDKGLSGAAAQDSGGYKYSADFVNAVQRTQTSHLPDPYDPTPVLQGIGVYYCDMLYGGVSFAVIEDRKFKSAPKPLLPEAAIWNGWPQNPDFNVKKSADHSEAVLLGQRQLDFLEAWAADWSGGTWIKTVLSQTIFANIATLPQSEISDVNVPKLRILNQDEYPPDDIPVSDFDSNGWPQTGRNKALRAIRKGFAFHIAGDQHLGSTIQYGIDQYRDAPFAVCVPSVSNVWPRRWCPKEPGNNQIPGEPRYTGDYEDGFGNKITVRAVSNPVFTGLEPARLYDRATGYGIVRFKRQNRQIQIECWPRLSDPSKSNAQQYPDWPMTINQTDNYNPAAYGYLPEVEVKGMIDPVIQVINEDTQQIVYTIRIKGTSMIPKVFEPGTYTLKVGDPDTKVFKIFDSLTPDRDPGKSEKRVACFSDRIDKQ